MVLLLVISTLLTSYLSSVTGQSQCTTPNGKSGSCISIYNCSSLAKLASSTSKSDIDFLRNSFCGFDGNTPLVCCPINGCTTPEGALGSCIGLYSCPHLIKMLQPPQSQETLLYVMRSRCEGTEQYSVCCGPPTTPPTSTTPATPVSTLPPTPPTPIAGGKCQLTAFPPDPNSECCGRDASGGNRIVGGTAAAIDEYPWLALIEYLRDNKHKLLCGGVLISGRYVMTAGHCIVGPVLNAGTPVNVRLGEYDTSKAGQDCVEVEGGGIDCNDGAVTVPIEKTIPHPEYDPASKLRRHDIALVRLDRIVGYTDFIRPICLPAVDFTVQPPPNTRLMTSGWGAVDDFKSSSNIKLKVGLPFVSLQDCQPSYAVNSRRVQLWDGQICAGGEKGKDSCKGDSGGPLMRENGTINELVGIVSFGPTPCGMDNVPGVYSKVFQYLPWITSQIVE